MPATPFDSLIYRDLWHDREAGTLFTDSAEIRAMLLVEGALAKAQGQAGVIPQISAEAIHRASLEVQIDPADLASETGRNAVVVPALVAAFRAAMSAPEHAQYIHWGATSQDIVDTGLMLRLRQALAIIDRRLIGLLRKLGELAGTHADLPMAGRTFGQIATPTSFGAVVAAWGGPLLGLGQKLVLVRRDVQQVSLSGAAGTLAAMGPDGPAIRAVLAEELGLGDPGVSWHATRDTLAELAAWLTQVTGALGKMGDDLTLMAQSGIDEVDLGDTGASSTMPQKSNPIAPELLVALARQMIGLNVVMQSAVLHRQQRDGAAWFSENLSLPQMVLATARALDIAYEMAGSLSPDAEAMQRPLDPEPGLIYAEALSFAIARTFPRPEAQAAVKRLCAQAAETGRPLHALASQAYPELDFTCVFDPRAQLGQAAAEARAFAAACRDL